MILRHHLVTTKLETSFEKILFNEHASNAAHVDCNLSLCFACQAFDSQRNNKDIFRKDLRGMQCAKEMLSSNQGNFSTNPQKSETNDRSALEQFSVPIPNDVSAFMQLFVPNDIPAITT
jgi:hypothetical protein